MFQTAPQATLGCAWCPRQSDLPIGPFGDLEVAVPFMAPWETMTPFAVLADVERPLLR
jgi:hypothetical protein